MIDWFAQNFLVVNSWLGGNLGLTLILLGVLLRLVYTPIVKQQGSMRDLNPKLRELKERFKSNPRKLQQEQMRLYREAGINPLASTVGCLGMALSLAVFFLLFFSFSRIAASGLNTQFLVWDLAKPNTIPISGLPFPLPGPLPLATAFVGIIQAFMLLPEKPKSRDKSKPQDFSEAFSASASQFSFFVPIIFLIYSGSLASGLILAYLANSLTGIIQQYHYTGLGGLKRWVLKVIPQN